MNSLALWVCELKHIICLNASDVLDVIASSLLVAVSTVSLLELCDSALIHCNGVCKNSSDNVVLCELIVFSHLDTAKEVSYTADSKKCKLVKPLSVNAKILCEEVATFRIVEESDELLAVLIVNSDDDVCLFYIVNPWNVLIADTLDVVLAKSVLKKCRALDCFACAELECWEFFLELVSCADSSS